MGTAAETHDRHFGLQPHVNMPTYDTKGDWLNLVIT